MKFSQINALWEAVGGKNSPRISSFLLVSLSFLGPSIPKPTAKWVVMIADGRSWLLQAWWICIFPGVAISLLIVSLNLVTG